MKLIDNLKAMAKTVNVFKLLHACVKWFSYCVCLLLPVSAAAQAQLDMLEIVVPQSEGGMIDRTARAMADQLTLDGNLAKKIVVVNRPGGQGQLARSYVTEENSSNLPRILISISNINTITNRINSSEESSNNTDVVPFLEIANLPKVLVTENLGEMSAYEAYTNSLSSISQGDASEKFVAYDFNRIPDSGVPVASSSQSFLESINNVPTYQEFTNYEGNSETLKPWFAETLRIGVSESINNDVANGVKKVLSEALVSDSWKNICTQMQIECGEEVFKSNLSERDATFLQEIGSVFQCASGTAPCISNGQPACCAVTE